MKGSEGMTPLPWYSEQPWAGFGAIRGAGNQLVFGVTVGTPDERAPAETCAANMAFIIEACNAHDGLLAENATLRAALEGLLRRGQRFIGESKRTDLRRFSDEIDAALTPEEGNEPGKGER